MVQPVDTEVLIVGAGPTGLTLAFELGRRGIACEIIDSLPGPSDKSRALAIHARTLEIFEQMGLIDEFLEIGWKSHAFTVYDKTKQIVRMTLDELECAYPFVLSIPQWHTERILAEAVRSKDNDIQWNTSLVSFTQETGFVEATIRDLGSVAAAADCETKMTCRWLVGCDGARSTVRKLLGVPFPGFPYWEQYVLADVDFETSLDTQDHYLFSAEDGIAGFHPFAPSTARIFADIAKIRRPPGNADRLPEHGIEIPEPTLEQLQNILDYRGPGFVQLKRLNWLSMHTIYRRQVESYRYGRILLAGDAAHLHSPTSGQGMNLGIQDAFNLAWKLALVIRRFADEVLLDSYSDERRLVGKRVSTMSDLFSRINEMRNPFFQVLRNKVGPILAAQKGIRERYRNAVAGLSTNYRLSPVVAQYVHKEKVSDRPKTKAPSNGHDSRIDWSFAPASGDRAPDSNVIDTETGESIRLFDILKTTEHHLLLFAGEHCAVDWSRELIDISELIEQQYGNVIKHHIFVESDESLSGLQYKGKKYYDPDLSIHRKYGAKIPCLFLIRPDGYVAFRSSPPNERALALYLKSIFVRASERIEKEAGE